MIFITSHQSEWPSLINPQITSAGGAVEKREPSCTAGGNVNWYSHYGEQFGDTGGNVNWYSHYGEQFGDTLEI